MADADEHGERKLFSMFDQYDEFLNYQTQFLAHELDVEPSSDEDNEEERLFRKLCSILDSYQEQSYLLDPHLEGLVVPVVNALKQYATLSVLHPDKVFSMKRITRTSQLLYQYIKCRGHKTIIRFFPHEISDLSIVLGYMQKAGNFQSDIEQWALRYVFLLWLSLICMLPFDLAQFDETEGDNRTTMAIESLGKSYLISAGLERHGAALLLSRLYMRKDTIEIFGGFVRWSTEVVLSSTELFSVIGCLQVLCEILKSTPMAQAKIILADLFPIADALESSPFISNTVVRKYKTKLISRAALRMVPGKTISSDEDADVPEEIETILEQLFAALQDKDTVVRWSAAKGVARVANPLPGDFADQILSTVMGLFSIHSLAAATIYDIPALAESTWHGACLACAEMARRGLVRRDLLPELLDWMSKALCFDLRKGAHSIGANVRDAAAYVVWALARSKDPSELRPYADNLARQLVTIALFDREIHIRRAASAAFQEHVGRTNLFPHGIDVLRKTDFYAVSIRKNAFLVAAPQVAEHAEYRSSLIEHLLNVSIRHWDISMRTLSAESIRQVCLNDLDTLGPQIYSKAIRLLESPDNADIHGGLLVLTELSIAYSDTAKTANLREEQKQNIFKCLSAVPHSVLVGPRNEIVTAAACELLARTITTKEIELQHASSVPQWRNLLDHGLKHRSVIVQEAAAKGLNAISKLVDCSAILKSGSFASQQSLGRVLGSVDYDQYPQCLPESVECLLNCVKPATTGINANLEARLNCYTAIPRVIENVAPHLVDRISPGVFNELVDALISGLDDYTVDERGDVGSWIRIACIEGLTKVAEVLVSRSKDSNDRGYCPIEKYQIAVNGILKQGLERLDGVRHKAGECILRLLRLPDTQTPSAERWTLRDSSLLKELFIVEGGDVNWSDGAWLFPRAVKLLNITHYRQPVLLGLLASLGSKTESTHKPVSTSLVAHIKSLPIESSDGSYDLVTFVNDLKDHARANWSSNTVVMPVLQTFNVLLEGGALVGLEGDSGPPTLSALHSLVSRHVDKIKNVQRIHETMKIIVNLLAFPSILDQCIASLALFLGHRFPSIRSETAEYLYLKLQTIDLDKETEEVEEVLLDTEWATGTLEESQTRAQKIVNLFMSSEVGEE